MDAMLRSLMTENVEMTVELETELWSGEADRGQLEQVLMNLVVNALDAMPDGGMLRIQTSNIDLNATDGQSGPNLGGSRYVMLLVHDTGRGMDSATPSHIFDTFFTKKDKSKGTGL